MTVHLTARLAWHDDGWDGRICERPNCNTYCVGRHSFPGDVVARERDLEREIANAGKPVAKLGSGELPPCIYSINAFGPQAIHGYSSPPDFFRATARSARNGTFQKRPFASGPMKRCTGKMSITKAVISTMIGDRERPMSSLSAIEAGKSLIFYYANYSNPFSEEESPRYALIGVSRVKKVGDRLAYDESNDYVRKRFARRFDLGPQCPVPTIQTRG